MDGTSNTGTSGEQENKTTPMGMSNNAFGLTGNRLVNQSEIARMLGCTPRTVSNLIRRRKIPVIKVGALNRFQPEKVVEALSEEPDLHRRPARDMIE